MQATAAPTDTDASTDASAAVSPDAGQMLEARGRRWLIWSFILCPCHLPWTLAALVALGGGSGVGAFVAGNRTLVGVAIAVVYLACVAVGFAYLRRAKAAGACRTRL